MEAGAIAAYHNRTDIPVVKALLSDDAPQFKKLSEEQALCWIHDGRNYKKLEPVVPFEKTRENKSELLLSLKYPEIPLHNNA
ncbi:MAG: hypothetical protein SCH70_14975, partial [Candidatus Methanoperedens sp.]|nr:hypothetical protein [Candidatus Methanoperedens sp.]